MAYRHRKETALLAVVGSAELGTATRAAAGSTRNDLLFYCASAVLYLSLYVSVSTYLFRWWERRYRPDSGDRVKVDPLLVGAH